MHQRPGLVEVFDVERDAKLEGCQCQPAFQHRAGGVERSNGCPPRLVVAGHLQLRHQFVDDVVGHHLPVGCDVLLGLAVKIDPPHLQRVTPQVAGNRVEDVLDGNGTLRPTKTPERGVALGVGLAAVAVHGHIGQPVGVVEMAQRAGHHRARQVGRMPGPRHHGDLGPEHPALVVVAHFVVVPKAVPPPGDEKIVVAVQPQLDRAFQPLRRHGGHTRKNGGLRFLAAKTTTHTAAFDLHIVGM